MNVAHRGDSTFHAVIMSADWGGAAHARAFSSYVRDDKRGGFLSSPPRL